MKTCCVFWTGGLDSTAMVVNLLKDGYKVDAYYVNIKNNAFQTKLEKAAIKKLYSEIKKLDFGEHLSLKGDLIDITVHQGSYNTQNGEPLLPMTFLAGISFIDTSKYDYFCMGYVSGDLFWTFREEFEKIYNAISEYKTLPQLWFPIRRTTKFHLKEMLETYKLFDFVQFCEYSKKACSYCDSCKRMIGENLMEK